MTRTTPADCGSSASLSGDSSDTPGIDPGIDLEPLAALVAKLAPREPLAATPMPGGASTRRYFRVALPDGKSAVGMYVPEGAKPEEIQKQLDAHRWPFLEVRDLLADRGVDVPAMLAEDTDRGWVLLEDLGDDTLAHYLLRRPSEKPALYTRAVRDLARAQAALAALPEGSIVQSRAFDEDLLRWEIDHFREWGLDARGKSLPAADRGAFDAIADRLARRIAGWSRGFVHRDYQSRNLMVRQIEGGTSLAWIDFQDALLGPKVYDLVALLNDSYQEFDRAFVEARLGEYARDARLSPSEEASLLREFDLVTVQRKLKDAGRFIFIDRVKGNSSFLRFVSPTIRKVRGALGRLQDDADMAALRGILARALPDEAA
jgi:aminoglycoside/choline kinase family phosphotransferase